MILKHCAFYLLTPFFLASCAKLQAAQASAPAVVAVPSVSAALVIPANALRLEAEDAVLSGNTVLTKRPGFSGKGYVGSFEKDGAKIVWALPQAKAGLYDVQIHYSAPFGTKGYDLLVNGAKLSGTFPATGEKFAAHSAGKVEIKDGANTLEIDRGWGYYDIDALDLVPAAAPKPLAAVPETLADPQASPEARALLHRLISSYGRQTLSGQYEPKDSAYVKTVTGQTPAIYGGDLIEYSPSRVAHGSKPSGTTEAIIAEAKAGRIITLSWHWNAPTGLIDAMLPPGKDGKPVDARWYKGFNSTATTFDFSKALDNPASPEHALLLRDIDTIAGELQKLSDAHVPVLWRPLHEAARGWFWWGAKGPEPYKKLWRLMFERLTVTHHLHNLIWVDCSGMDPAWYPGDAVVDVVGIDEYPADVADPLSSHWEDLKTRFDGKKLLALTEFGGVPDVDKMRRYGVQWSYFVSWTGDVGPHKMTADALKRIYGSTAVGNR